MTAVANTRAARGILDADELRSSLRETMPDCEVRMIHVRVEPQLQEMSIGREPYR